MEEGVIEVKEIKLSKGDLSVICKRMIKGAKVIEFYITNMNMMASINISISKIEDLIELLEKLKTIRDE